MGRRCHRMGLGGIDHTRKWSKVCHSRNGMGGMHHASRGVSDKYFTRRELRGMGHITKELD